MACSERAKDAEADLVAKSRSEIVLSSFPSDQPSPVENPAKIGEPAYVKLIVPNENLELRYQEQTDLFGIIVFKDDGQWINTDRDVSISLSAPTSKLKIVDASNGLEIDQVVINSGTPSVFFKIIGKTPGIGELELSSEFPMFSSRVEFSVIVPKPTSATNARTILPKIEECAETTYRFDGYFSLEESASVEVSGSGCAFYSDDQCSQRTTTIQVPADSTNSAQVFYKSSGQAFVELKEAKTNFAARSSCFAASEDAGSY